MNTLLNMTGRLAQLACAAAMMLAAGSSPRAGPVSLKLSVLGERERPDGSWEGQDLLAQPDARASRFQVTLHPERDVQISLVARLPDGTEQRIFPEPGKTGILAAGQTYSLPGPRAFYELEGEVSLQLQAAPVRGSLADSISQPMPAGLESGPVLQLSDGAHMAASQASLVSPGALRVSLPLSSR